MATKRKKTAGRKKATKAAKPVSVKKPAAAKKLKAAKKAKAARSKTRTRPTSKKHTGAATVKARGRKAGARKQTAAKVATRKPAATKELAKAKAPRKAKAAVPKKAVVGDIRREALPPPLAPPVAKAPPKRKAPVRKRPATVAPKQEHPAAEHAAGTPFYITTAISYPNGPPHIGHAYEVIATDAIARFMRLDGYDVFFLTGTDEHGQKIQQTAVREGLTPRQLLDRNVPLFEAMVKRLECSNTDFIHTTERRHHVSSEAIWERMQEAGDIYLDKYSGWYSVRDEAYYAEDETALNEQNQRIATKTGTPVEWVEEESYFFRLSAYQDKLLKLYERPNYVLPKERLNEVASFVRGGLQDLSISRTTFDWGVRVPGSEGHIMYVWVDALTNYITAVGYPDTEGETFRRYWPANLHVIGKDIVRFHAVYWPAFLMSAGIEVPRRIFSHGFLFNRGEKMSKSVGNVIDPFALIEAYGVDQLRYFFLREVPFGQDGNYSHEAIVNRTNADLANDLGNLAQRSLSMIAKQFNGELPKPGALSDADQAILAAADGMITKAREAMATQQLHQVLNAVWSVVAEANRYFAGEAPWALAKTDPAKQATVLYVTAEVLRQVTILAQPFVPTSAGKLLDLLAIPPDERSFAFVGGEHRIAAGAQLPPPSPVFPRYIEAEARAAQ
jgi:methionyl-tRNA synthetase